MPKVLTADPRIVVSRVLQDFPLSIHRPPPVQWCEENRYIPPEAGTQIPGKWNSALTPYLREILDNLHEESPIYKVTLMKAAQIGWTVGVLENAIVYIIGASPASTMYVTATEEIAKKRMQLNIDPAIVHAGLSHLLQPQTQKKNIKSRVSGDKVTLKQFPGGSLIIATLGSAKQAKSFSIRYLLLDEIDSAIDPAEEGDIIRLFIARTRAFGHSRKIFIGSTPKVEQTSKVYQHYLDGDRRKFFIPCKKCKKYQTLEFENLIFKDARGKWNPSKVYYRCPYCKSRWSQEDKDQALLHGEWRATAKPVDSGTRSYQISILYTHSAFYTWDRVAGDYIEAWKYSKRGDISALRDFYNTQLGIPWKERGYAPNFELIQTEVQGSYFRGTYPPQVLFTTMGIDVQGDRVEAELLGWSDRGISFSIDYFVLSRRKREDSAYAILNDFLTDILTRAVDHVQAPLLLACIDANYQPGEVYAYTGESDYEILPIIGQSHGENRKQTFVIDSVQEYGVNRGKLNVDRLKSEVYQNLRHERNKPFEKQVDYTCNFPRDYDKEYYKQLTAEQRVITQNPTTRQSVMKWHKIYYQNEALDCRVYAVAALHILVSQWSLKYWESEEPDYPRFFELAAHEQKKRLATENQK